MAHYFVRRGEKVFGPVTGEQVVGLAKSGKVRSTDEIATDKNGPWRPTTALATLRAVFGPSSVDPLGPVAADPFGIGPPSKERKPPFEMPEKKTLIIAGTVLGVLLISGLGAMFFFGGDDDDATVAVAEKTKQTSRASVPLGKRLKNYMLVKTMYVPGSEGGGIERYIVWMCFGLIGGGALSVVVLFYACATAKVDPKKAKQFMDFWGG